MATVSDEFMRQSLAKSKTYTLVILKATPKRSEPESDALVWEHGRRNFLLRDQGILAIVCPVADGTEISGIYIFTSDVDETRKVMDGDLAVKAGIFVYEVHPCRGFPGDALPG